jgi:5-oxoprolinase (ATP-hydrolysing) subunit A
MLILERDKIARDPEEMAARVLRILREGKIRTLPGTDLSVDNQTVCLHGDGPNAVDIARTIKVRLHAEGIQIRPLNQTVAAGL